MADLSTERGSTGDVPGPEPAPEPDTATTTPDADDAAPGGDGTASLPEAASPPESGTAPPEAAHEAETPPASTPEPAEVAADPPEPARSSRWTARVAGLSALLVALLVATVVLLVHNAAVGDLQAQRPVVLDAARRVALDLTTTSPETAGQRLQSLTQQSTGPFRDQVSATSATVEAMLKQGDVSSSAIVTAVGIEQLQADTATALVTVTVAITNNAAPQGTVQRSRLSVQLQRDGDRWLASEVEYVS